MKKINVLTSLSALAAVFVFGDAMAGSYNPSCDNNEYTFSYNCSTSINGVGGTVGGQCPLPQTWTYDPLRGFALSSTSTSYDGVNQSGWSVYACPEGVVASEANCTKKIGSYEMGEIVPSSVLAAYETGTTFYVQSDWFSQNYYINYTYDKSCGQSGSNLERKLCMGVACTLGDITQAGYNTMWTYNGTVVTSGESIYNAIKGVLDSYEYSETNTGPEITLVSKCTPKTYAVNFVKEGETTSSAKLYYANKTWGSSTDDSLWCSRTPCSTSNSLTGMTEEVLASLKGSDSGAVLRGFTMDSALSRRVTSDAAGFTGTYIPKNGDLRNAKLGLVTDAQTFYVASAQACAPGNGALCELTIGTNGSVTYKNCCKAGYNNDDLSSLTDVNVNTCPAN